MGLGSPIESQNAITVSAPGYVKGTVGSYAGLLISGNGQDTPIHELVNTGDFYHDLALVNFALRFKVAELGVTASVVNFDSSVDNVANDKAG